MNIKILTKQEALTLLENAKETTPDFGWIYHSLCVGETAGIIAKKLNLDVDKAITLGYIHDIGKFDGNFKYHVINGYKYLKDLGYEDEYANNCLTHSYLNNDCYCTAGGIPEEIPFRTEFIKNHEYTIYEKIINICDLICTKNRMTLEQRLIEIMLRKGCHENTIYHITEAKKLKNYFDEILGCNLYDLFDDIKENL